MVCNWLLAQTFVHNNPKGISASDSFTIMRTVLFYTWCVQELQKMSLSNIHHKCMNSCKALSCTLKKGVILNASSNINNSEGKKITVIKWIAPVLDSDLLSCVRRRRKLLLKGRLVTSLHQCYCAK